MDRIIKILAIILLSLLIIVVLASIGGLFKADIVIKEVAPCSEYVAVPVNTCTDNWQESISVWLKGMNL